MTCSLTIRDPSLSVETLISTDARPNTWMTGKPEVIDSSVGLVPTNASALLEARFHESVKLGEVLCARSIEPFEGGRWRLRRMRANGWTRSNGYGN
jgi:hypothetical protein